MQFGRGASHRFHGIVGDIRRHSSRIITSGERDAITMDAADEDVWEHWYPWRLEEESGDDQIGSLDFSPTLTPLWYSRIHASMRPGKQHYSLVEDSGDSRRYISDGITAGAHVAYRGDDRRLSIIAAPTV